MELGLESLSFGEGKGEVKGVETARPARWKIANVKANSGLEKLNKACVLSTDWDLFVAQDGFVSGAQKNMEDLLKQLEAESVAEVKDPHHVVPEKATAGTAKPHIQAAQREVANAAKRVKEAVFALQRVIPAVVEAGKAKHRARVNTKRYNATTDALEERRKERVSEANKRREKKRKQALRSLLPDDD